MAKPGFIDFPKIDIAIQGMENIKIPRMIKIRQRSGNPI